MDNLFGLLANRAKNFRNRDEKSSYRSRYILRGQGFADRRIADT